MPIAKQSEHINESAELVIFKSGLSIESKFAVGGIQFTIEFLSSDEDILLFNDNLPFEIYTKEDENNQFNVLMFNWIRFTLNKLKLRILSPLCILNSLSISISTP